MPKTKSRAPRRAQADQPLRSKARDSTQEWLEDRLGQLRELEVRRMFGGAGIYAEGTMFGILHGGRLYLKTNETTRAQYTERGMGPFRPRRGAVLKSYHEVPAETLDDDVALLSWARAALSVADVAQPQSKARAVNPEQSLDGYPPKVGFEHGNRLADPDGLLEPMGKQVRFVRLVPGGAIPVNGIRTLIGAALQTKPERRKT